MTKLRVYVGPRTIWQRIASWFRRMPVLDARCAKCGCVPIDAGPPHPYAGSYDACFGPGTFGDRACVVLRMSLS